MEVNGESPTFFKDKFKNSTIFLLVWLMDIDKGSLLCVTLLGSYEDHMLFYMIQVRDSPRF